MSVIEFGKQPIQISHYCSIVKFYDAAITIFSLQHRSLYSSGCLPYIILCLNAYNECRQHQIGKNEKSPAGEESHDTWVTPSGRWERRYSVSGTWRIIRKTWRDFYCTHCLNCIESCSIHSDSKYPQTTHKTFANSNKMKVLMSYALKKFKEIYLGNIIVCAVSKI